MTDDDLRAIEGLGGPGGEASRPPVEAPEAPDRRAPREGQSGDAVRSDRGFSNDMPAPRPSLAPFGVLTDDDRAKAAGARAPIVVGSRDADAACDYVELHARSAFSFLRASSLPEDLAHAAAASGHRIFGLADVGGLYGIPRFHAIARRRACARWWARSSTSKAGAGSRSSARIAEDTRTSAAC